MLASDGSLFGPADAPTLAEWLTQGRITAASMLESEVSFERSTVEQVLAQAGIPLPPPPAPKDSTDISAAVSASYVRLAWMLGACGTFGFLAGFWMLPPAIGAVLSTIGVHLARKACAAEHRGGQAALLFNAIILFLSVCVFCFHILVGW